MASSQHIRIVRGCRVGGREHGGNFFLRQVRFKDALEDVEVHIGKPWSCMTKIVAR